jgi:hypothetical protein
MFRIASSPNRRRVVLECVRTGASSRLGELTEPKGSACYTKDLDVGICGVGGRLEFSLR